MGLRVLHAANMRTPMVGVIRQMEYEQLAADELGISWTSRMMCNGQDDSPITVKGPDGSSYRRFKQAYYQWLNKQIPSADLIMLRYSKNDFFQYKFIKSCPIPVVTMHHTMETYELIGHANWRSQLRATAEKVSGYLSLRQVSAIGCVTNQIGEYQRERSGDSTKMIIHYGNGAYYGDNPVLPQQTLNPECHEFIFLSSKFQEWMGLDLLFEAAQKCDRQFKVHIVGQLTQAQEAELSADPRFVAHGYMDSSDVDVLMAGCTLGLSTFGIHRKRFTEGNTLKAREYLRAGLPVYAGHKDIFSNEFPYHKDGPADFDTILAFADQMTNVDRKTVSETARPLIEKKHVLADMYKALHGVPGVLINS